MKKSVSSLWVFALVVVAIIGFHACSKDSNSGSDCRTCKAIGPDNNVTDEASVCNEAQEAAFRGANPGREIICN